MFGVFLAFVFFGAARRGVRLAMRKDSRAHVMDLLPRGSLFVLCRAEENAALAGVEPVHPGH
jgi:hypothetical protein